MKKILPIIFLSILSLSQLALSADTGTGKVRIKHIGGYGTGNLVFIYTENNQVAPGSCNSTHRWIIDLAGPAGKEQFSLVLAAQLAGKEIKVTSKNTCNLWADAGDIHNIGFVDF